MSCFVHFDKPVEHMSGAELLEAERISIEVVQWNEQHPEAQSLNEQYQDLILFEPELKQLMERVPMMERLGRNSLPADELLNLRKAIDAWGPLATFYKSEIDQIGKLCTKNMEFFEDTPADQHKAGSLALIHFKDVIENASRQLSKVTSNLLKAGFTYSSFLPGGHRRAG